MEVGTRKEKSSEPWDKIKGRKDWEERGVLMPVWGAVEVVPYIVVSYRGFYVSLKVFVKG